MHIRYTPFCHVMAHMSREMRFPTMCDQQRLRPACAYAQSDQSLCLSLEYYMSVKLLTVHHLEFLSLKGGFTCSSESTLVKMPHCWISCVMAQLCFNPCHAEYFYLSYDIASGSEITPCNKIDKPLVVYRFTGNVMTSITT